MLDDGHLTDNRGRVANFKNTLIIMTSNTGSDTILENFEDLANVGDEHRQEILDTTKEEVFDTLKENMRPEFLNRIDERIMFLPLTREEIKKILVLLLRKTGKMLARQGLTMELSESAMDWLANRGYDPQFGARPMKRVLQQDLIDELSKDLIGGKFVRGDQIYVGLEGDHLVFAKTPFGESTTPVTPPAEEVAATEVAESAGEATNGKSKRGRRGKSPKPEISAEERRKTTEELEQATKDLLDTVQDLKEDGGGKGE